MIIRLIDSLLVKPFCDKYVEGSSDERNLLRSLEQGVLPTVMVDHRSDAVVFINYLLASWLPVNIKKIDFLTPHQTWREMAQGLADKLTLAKHLQNTQDTGIDQQDASALEDFIDLQDDRVVRRLCRTLRDSDGRYLGHLYQFEDVSRDANRRRNLRRTIDHYRTLVEISADWTWSWHGTTRNVLCVGTMRGASADTSKHYQDCQGQMHAIPDMTSQDWRAWHRRLQAQETFRDLVVHSQDSNGFSKIYLVSGAPTHDTSGARIGFTGSAIDQTSYRLVDAIGEPADRLPGPSASSWYDHRRH